MLNVFGKGFQSNLPVSKSVGSLFISNNKPPKEEKAITLDSQQSEIVHSGYDNILVIAGAGSGKTRVLTERIKYLIDSGVPAVNIVAITFTNMAAEEMRDRLSSIPTIGDAFIGTIHSFANKILSNSGEEYEIYSEEHDLRFYRYLIRKYCHHLTLDRYFEYKDLDHQVSSLKVDPDVLSNFFTSGERAEFKLLNRKACEIEDGDNYPESIDTLCKENNVITFDDLIVKANDYFTSIGASVEHLLVDEFQDIGSLEFKFFVGLHPINTFFCGDDFQCQPRGTKVTMEDGSIKNIEDISVGDRVLSCRVSSNQYYRLSRRGKGKEVESISTHKAEDLITIKTESGIESSYTKNHRCLARIHYDGNESKSVVYIMENSKGYFRVGSTQLFTSNDRNFGVRGRMNTEGGINAWILDVFDSPEEAWLCEQICSYKFGIPQITWSTYDTRFTKEDMDSLYHHLGNLTDKVSECLSMYGRDINYPIFSRYCNRHFSKNHVTEVVACNLIPGVMDVALPTFDTNAGRYKNYYEMITHRFVIDNTEHEVFGLKVKDTETYVADGILTHNSIYGFKGGAVDIFMSLANNPDFHCYYLTNNYRNGSAIIDFASQIINQVNIKIPKEITPCRDFEGEYIVDTKLHLGYYLQQILDKGDFKDWFILTRTNKELFDLMVTCDSFGIPNVTFKREGMSMNQIQTLLASDKVKILTVHTSKGLESPNVLLFGNFPVQTPSYIRNEEERKVMYVGITRAENKVIVLN